MVVCDMADDGGVVRILHGRVLLMSGGAVMGAQCEQKAHGARCMTSELSPHLDQEDLYTQMWL